MRSVKDLIVAQILVLFAVISFGQCAIRVYYDKCDYKGFTCVKSTKISGRYDITFTCNPLTTWDVELYLWQFRAPTTIAAFTIANCSNLTLHLQCTNEGRPIQSIRVTNVTKLTIPGLVHGLSHTPPEVVFEDIQELDTIYTRTFIQIKKFPFSRFGCANPVRDLESIVFRNVKIGTVEREAFHNLTNFKNMTFDNTTIDRVSASAAHIFLDKNAELLVTKSNISVLEFMSFHVRGSKVTFLSNFIKEMQSTSLKATIYSLIFVNNTVGWLHCGGFNVLAQSVKLSVNNFNYLGPGAFQNIGPGLPENALKGFGDLNFNYEFINNLVESLEVGSLHPDWRAYKKVGGNLVIKYNSLKCSCNELAWLSAREGFGRDFSSLDDFHEKILNRANANLCVDAPCRLPVDSVKFMIIKDGRCDHNLTLKDFCKMLEPTTTTTTKKPVIKPTYTTVALQYYKRSWIGAKATTSQSTRSIDQVNFFLDTMFMLMLYLLVA